MTWKDSHKPRDKGMFYTRDFIKCSKIGLGSMLINLEMLTNAHIFGYAETSSQ